MGALKKKTHRRRYDSRAGENFGTWWFRVCDTAERAHQRIFT